MTRQKVSAAMLSLLLLLSVLPPLVRQATAAERVTVHVAGLV